MGSMNSSSRISSAPHFLILLLHRKRIEPHRQTTTLPETEIIHKTTKDMMKTFTATPELIEETVRHDDLE